MKRHGLSWALLGLALVCLAAGTLAGWNEYAEAQAQHGQAAAFGEFLTSQWAFHLVGSLWDEFIFGAAFGALSARLIHAGSADSRDSDDEILRRLEVLDARLDGWERWR